jgi:hypothetical protein
MIKLSSWNYRIRESVPNKFFYPLGVKCSLIDRKQRMAWELWDENSLLFFRGKALFNRKTSYDFEIMYLFGFYFQYLWGWYYKSRKDLAGTEFSHLIWNINNLFDLETGLFIGIDAYTTGRTCGYLDLIRKHPVLTQGEKAELLVYVFVAEISFAVYFKKCGLYILEDISIYDKHYIFLEMEEYLPYIYSFVSRGDQIPDPINLKSQDILQKWNPPRVCLDNYIRNIAEAEVFLFFFRSLACVIGGSWSHLLFSKGEKWYETCFKLKGFNFVNEYVLKSGVEIVTRKACFDLCVVVYKAILDKLAYLKTDVSVTSVGFWWKISMKLKLIFWLLFLQLAWLSNYSRFWYKIYLYLIPDSLKKKAFYVKWVEDFVSKCTRF